MGWLTLLLLSGAAMALLVVLGLRKPLWSLAAAAVMLGATGYAFQGSPDVPAQVAQPQLAAEPTDPGLIALRDRMLGKGTAQAAYVVAADALARAGAKRQAVQAILAGIRRYPETPLLWVALGNELSAHDGGRVSPTALFAYQQAFRLAPTNPGPPFFLGMAHVRGGDFAAARPLWARAVALTPASVSYRVEIEERLGLLSAYLAQPAPPAQQ